MKWIGQHIFDFAVRIRNKLYDSLGSSGSPKDSVAVDYSASSTGYAKTLTTDGEVLAWTNRTYTHTESSGSDTWTITHNMNRHPSVTVVDSAETVVIGTIVYNSANQITLTFFTNGADAYSLIGKAYLN